MKIQILTDAGYLELNEYNTLHNALTKIVECTIVTELNPEAADYFLIFDRYDLDAFDKEILARTILLSVPSPSIEERLAQHKVAGAVESRIYFNNKTTIFGLKEVIDLKLVRKGLFNYAEESGYISILKKDEDDENYTLANMIVDYLKMHQDYFKRVSTGLC